MTFDKRKKIRIGKKERHVKKDDNRIYNKPSSLDSAYVGSVSKHRKESSEVLSSKDIDNIPSLEILPNEEYCNMCGEMSPVCYCEGSEDNAI